MLTTIENDEIKRTALEVEKPSENVSAKYTFISTKQILADLQSTGWQVDKVALKRNNPEFGKHAITLTHPEFSLLTNEEKLNITVINSHDGQSSTRFFFGLLRLVCSNGLMVGSTTFQTPRIRHVGYSVEKVQTALTYMQDHATLVKGHVEAMKQTKLTDDEINQLAIQSFKLRGFSQGVEVNLKQLTQVRRSADADNSLWNVYNRLQETLVNGLFEIVSPVKETRGFTTFERRVVKKARPIKAIDTSINLNRSLWDLAIGKVK